MRHAADVKVLMSISKSSNQTIIGKIFTDAVVSPSILYSFYSLPYQITDKWKTKVALHIQGKYLILFIRLNSLIS